MTIDLEEELAAGMREFAGQFHLDNAVVATAARRHRRHRAVMRWTAAAGALTVVTAAAVAIAIPSPSDTGPTAQPLRTSPSPSATMPPALTVAYVSEQVIEALNVADEHIQHVTWREPDSGLFRGESWGDHTTRATRSVVYHRNGAFDRENLDVYSAGQVHSLFIDYDAHTYRQETREDNDGADPAYTGTLLLNPTIIRAWMSDRGRYGITIVGTEQIDGVNTVHLRVDAEDPTSTLNANLWVDDTNYTIVRRVDTQGGIRFQADVNWLPRTPENVTLLAVVPPPGFIQVPY